MGACASVAKAMRGEEGAAPPPEAPKEETTTDVTEVTTDRVVKVDEEKVEGSGDKQKENKKVGNEDKYSQSLGSLLNETEAAKESSKEDKTSQTKMVKEEEKEAKVVEIPVSNAEKTQKK